MHWPHLQPTTARNVRRTPLHDRLAAAGACFGEADGWERANWYAPAGVDPAYEYSYGRQNWFEHVAAEHRAAREAVALFDLSSFTKVEVAGAGRAAPCCSAPARRTSTSRSAGSSTRLLLNERGGIELDGTVTRLGEDRFLVVTPDVTAAQDALAGCGGAPGRERRSAFYDATSGLRDPRRHGAAQPRAARPHLARTTSSTTRCPGAARGEIEVGDGFALCLRVSFVGELGCELYSRRDSRSSVYDAVVAAGADLGLRHAGYHALDSLRDREGLPPPRPRHRPRRRPATRPGSGSPSPSTSPAASPAGRDRAFADGAPARRQVFVRLDDPEPLLLDGESLLRDGVPVGRLTSAAYGHTLGSAAGLAFVAAEAAEDGPVSVRVAGRDEPATLSTTPFYDPSGARMRGSPRRCRVPDEP